MPYILKEEKIRKMVELAMEHEWRDAALLRLTYETAGRPGGCRV